jgi:DNA-binding NarL/FixJ family response regulator
VICARDLVSRSARRVSKRHPRAVESAELAKVVDRASLQNEFSGIFDLLLIDFNCFDRQSRGLLELIRSRNPRMRAAVMSMSNARIDVLSCLSAKFHGYLHKNQPEAELVGAITDLLSGRIYVPPSVIKQNHDDPISRGSLELESLSLTRSQREVISLLARGMSTKEIARELNIAVGTAKIHTTALLHALGARNRTEAAFIAAKTLQSEVPNIESDPLKMATKNPRWRRGLNGQAP